jgi:hypothetical protein
MSWPRALLAVVALALLAGCGALKAGREFPSPAPQMIVIGKTDKPFLQRVFGEPYQVGLDSGDSTWTWFYGEADTDLSKSLTVRFNADGTVKSFSSNFREDMERLR